MSGARVAGGTTVRMTGRPARWVAAALLPCAVLVASCAGVLGADRGLNPSWPAAAAAVVPGAAGGRRPTVVLGPWDDPRPGAPGRRLGELRATVFGLDGRELRLGRDATAVVDAAVREQLQAQGLAVVAAPEQADLRLDGVLQALTLNVAGRDERHVALQATLRRQPGGQVLWTGAVEDRDDRFAGVSGNSRADLEAYLGAGIAKAAAQLAVAVREHAGPMPEAAPSPVLPPAAAAAPAAVVAAPVAAAPAAAAGGTLVITTVPARVKVYVDDVYHGLTPITLELPAGVSQLHFKLDGYRGANEKVAIRRGVTTELELKLER